MTGYFNCHTHTHYSNLRLLDCINTPERLIRKAAELGMCGIAITDHECISGWVTAKNYEKKIREDYPDFKVGLGNEIYLVDNRESGQKYYHFILIAKDLIGAKALKELSTKAWYNSYIDRRMERVPTTKDELKEIIQKYRGHVIATSACIGGELSSNALLMAQAESVNDMKSASFYYEQIISFVDFIIDLFKDDFYIECAPSTFADQIMVNKKLRKIAEVYNIPLVVGTDAHYLTADEKPIHKAYLNAKDGEREVDSFYEYARLMDEDELYKLLGLCFEKDFISKILKNTLEIYNKIEDFSLQKPQQIPKVEVTDYEKGFVPNKWRDKYPILCSLIWSDEIQERYWVNECIKALQEKNLFENEKYLERLETEADVIKTIGNKLNDCLFAYFNTFKHYIDLFWASGSIVGPGRGSATGFLSNYLLGITQLDPVRWELPWWRFLNQERAELPDIDIDLAPSKRPAIFQAIRDERGELGLAQVATFGTEGTKSAIQTACRGYRSEDYPEGIDVDEALYMSSLIPQERGFLWPIEDVINGNEEKERLPVTSFIREVNQYPGLLDIITHICGLINKRSSHASGVILYGDDPYDTAAFMRTPSGDLITCFDLHDCESCGDTKYDFLVTEISDKIIQCIKLLQADNLIEQGDLRDIYNKYLHPEVIDTTDPQIWEHLGAGDIMDVFQFSTGEGLAIAKKVKPQSMFEMMAASAMMRLMSEKGKESQQDRYLRIKTQGIQVFDDEMRNRGISDATRQAMHKYCDTYWGCVPIQEQMMEILMDKDITGFTLGEANAARKIVAKKKMNEIPKLRQQVYQHCDNETKAEYIWETAIRPSLGYAFSKNHSLPYSFVGVQTIYLATHFNPIYWDCACLIVNSGSLEDNSEIEIVDIYEPEHQELIEGTTFEDQPDRRTKIKRTSATDYGKIAKAMGDMRAAGIKISLVDINRSDFGFKPDVENNQILFGMKAILNVSDDTVKEIIAHRPYVSPKEFLYKLHLGKQAMISLIKGGAFDNMMDRRKCMAWYIWETCDKKKRITLQNMASLIKYELIPDTQELNEAKRIFEFNRYLKACCKYSNKDYYKCDERALSFLVETEKEDLIEEDNLLLVKSWDKVYQKEMDIFRNWIANNKEEILNSLNEKIFLEDWNKYAQGTISAWEMEALCFYYHEHELAHLNKEAYGISDFNELSVEPEVDRSFVKNGKTINIFKLSKICGTCIAKNKTKSIVTLLTTTGVVEVKFRKEYFSLFDKQISERGPDGVKHVVEKSWFNRGNMILVMGIRSGDTFIPKKYSSSNGHQLYKIESIDKDGFISLKTERYKGDIQ